MKHIYWHIDILYPTLEPCVSTEVMTKATMTSTLSSSYSSSLYYYYSTLEQLNE